MNINAIANPSDYYTIKDAGYIFIKYLDRETNKAIFQIGNSLEIWNSDNETKPYGFWFFGKFWTYECQYEKGNK